jgi:hypothetical protein
MRNRLHGERTQKPGPGAEQKGAISDGTLRVYCSASLILKMEAVRSCEVSVGFYRRTLSCNPEDGTLHVFYISF